MTHFFTPLFYSHDNPWVKEMDGVYYDAKYVDEKIAQLKAYRKDLARAISIIEKRVGFSVADEFAGTTLFETWEEIRDAIKEGQNGNKP